MEKSIFSIVALNILAILVFASKSEPQNKIEWSSFNMGYALSTGTNAKVHSIVGQTFVGEAQQGTTRLISGFFADTLFRTPSAVKEEEGIPHSYSLAQNYPNPFNPSTKLKYEIPMNSRVTLKIYDVLGRVVSTIVDGIENVGRKEVTWNAGSVASGVYFYRLEATSISDPSKSFTQVKKMVLIR